MSVHACHVPGCVVWPTLCLGHTFTDLRPCLCLVPNTILHLTSYPRHADHACTTLLFHFTFHLQHFQSPSNSQQRQEGKQAYHQHVVSLKQRRLVTASCRVLWACIQTQQANNATAGVNLMLMNGLPIDVSLGTELYPLLERISAEVPSPVSVAPGATSSELSHQYTSPHTNT